MRFSFFGFLFVNVLFWFRVVDKAVIRALILFIQTLALYKSFTYLLTHTAIEISLTPNCRLPHFHYFVSQLRRHGRYPFLSASQTLSSYRRTANSRRVWIRPWKKERAARTQRVRSRTSIKGDPTWISQRQRRTHWQQMAPSAEVASPRRSRLQLKLEILFPAARSGNELSRP